MKSAEPADKTLITDLLTRSFEDNLSVNYIIKQDKKRKPRIAALMDYSFDVCSMFGEIWLSDDKKGCALVLYPQKKQPSIRTFVLDLKLIIETIGFSGIGKALSRESKIKAKQPKTAMLYLWFIGVNPDFQHQGIGTQLLKDILAHAAKQSLPVYLETSTTQNIPWYQRSGFYIYDQLELTYTLNFLANL
jgi:hypothetical protein